MKHATQVILLILCTILSVEGVLCASRQLIMFTFMAIILELLYGDGK